MRLLDVVLDNGDGEEQETIRVGDVGAPPILFVSPYGRTDFDRYERDVVSLLPGCQPYRRPPRLDRLDVTSAFTVTIPMKTLNSYTDSERDRAVALGLYPLGMFSGVVNWHRIHQTDEHIVMTGEADQAVVSVFMAMAQGHPIDQLLDVAESQPRPDWSGSQ